MITTLLPWAALALVALALLARDGMRQAGEAEGTWFQRLRPCMGHLWAALALILASLAAGYVWKDGLKNLWPSALGFAGGVALAAAALKLGRLRSQPCHDIFPKYFGSKNRPVL